MRRVTSLADRITNSECDRGRHDRRHAAWGRRLPRPRLELLEDRPLLSIDIVENSNDSGPGSLRETIANASPGDTIEFDMTPGHVTSPITLTSGSLDIGTDVDIVGPGASSLTVERDPALGSSTQFSVFVVDSGATVGISGLTIAHGDAADGGGIDNVGTVTLTNSTLTDNSAVDGGGIYNSGTVTMSAVSLTDNVAAGAAERPGPAGPADPGVMAAMPRAAASTWRPAT